jgi:hypothetical protein
MLVRPCRNAPVNKFLMLAPCHIRGFSGALLRLRASHVIKFLMSMLCAGNIAVMRFLMFARLLGPRPPFQRA